MAGTPEGRLKLQVKDLLGRLGAYTFMPVQGGYGAKTIDFLVCVQGRFVGIETKAPGKKATPLQRLCMQRIRDAGGIAFEADNIQTVIDELTRNGIDLTGRQALA